MLLVTRYEKKTFTDLSSRGKGTIADVEFVKCHFAHCVVVETGARSRCTVRNVRLVNCSQDRCYLLAPILEDVLVDGLNTKGQMPAVHGAAFNRVTLRGKIDRLWIRPDVVEPSRQEAIDKANAAFYKNVEWALDISQIDCKELDIRGVPVKLIRLDPRDSSRRDS